MWRVLYWKHDGCMRSSGFFERKQDAYTHMEQNSKLFYRALIVYAYYDTQGGWTVEQD